MLLQNMKNMQYNITVNNGKKLGFKGLLWYKGNYDTAVSDMQFDFYYRDTEVVTMH